MIANQHLAKELVSKYIEPDLFDYKSLDYSLEWDELKEIIKEQLQPLLNSFQLSELEKPDNSQDYSNHFFKKHLEKLKRQAEIKNIKRKARDYLRASQFDNCIYLNSINQFNRLNLFQSANTKKRPIKKQPFKRLNLIVKKTKMSSLSNHSRQILKILKQNSV